MILKLKYFRHLIAFDIPTIIITAIVMTLEPPGTLSLIGFIGLMIAVNFSYFLGILEVTKDLQ